MGNETENKIIVPPSLSQAIEGKTHFPGFAPPTSNTTYTPNQFFDVCLPNASRGCVRIVAYLIRKTLGWCDVHGNPQREHIEVSNSELERRAGVGHDMIRAALDEGLAGHFIECVRAGRARAAGDAGETAVYALKWDATPRYARTLDDFRGFFEGEGHRTDIPNQFFDSLIPTETLSVIKVVGTVIRYSIGFVAKHGRRRQQATLAYSQILKVSGLSSRRTLAGAIREAVAKNYIVRLDPGYFSARVLERRSATYAVRWSDNFHLAPSAPTLAPKRIPAQLGITPSEKDPSALEQDSEPATSNAPIRLPANPSEKETIETKQLNEKIKQWKEAAELLRKEGFDVQTAFHLASRFQPGVVIRQIQWLPLRHISKSRTGLLRRAIEGDWPQPGSDRAPSARPPVTPPEPLPTGYLTWLAEQREAFREEAPDDYARFIAKRNRRRADLARERIIPVREQLLTSHDDPAGHLMDFQKFLALPDVHRWAENINHQSQKSSS